MQRRFELTLTCESAFETTKKRPTNLEWQLDLPVGVRPSGRTSANPVHAPASHTLRRKAVTFSPIAKVKKVATINDLKKATDINAIWFSRKEYKEMESNCIKTVDRIKQGWDLNPDEECLRGLEKMFETEQERRMEAIRVVLAEQSKQQEWGVHDEEYLADLYREFSDDSHDMAVAAGFRDSREIFFPKGFFVTNFKIG